MSIAFQQTKFTMKWRERRRCRDVRDISVAQLSRSRVAPRHWAIMLIRPHVQTLLRSSIFVEQRIVFAIQLTLRDASKAIRNIFPVNRHFLYFTLYVYVFSSIVYTNFIVHFDFLFSFNTFLSVNISYCSCIDKKSHLFLKAINLKEKKDTWSIQTYFIPTIFTIKLFKTK